VLIMEIDMRKLVKYISKVTGFDKKDIEKILQSDHT